MKALRGQLAAYGGTAAEWPDDLPEPFQPEPFTHWAETVTADLPGFDLMEVDCGEFPCLVVIEPGPDAPRTEDGSIDWHAAGEVFQTTPPPGVSEDDDLSMGISVMQTDDDGVKSGVMALYNVPDNVLDDSVAERLEVRSRDDAERLAEDRAPQ